MKMLIKNFRVESFLRFQWPFLFMSQIRHNIPAAVLDLGSSVFEDIGLNSTREHADVNKNI